MDTPKERVNQKMHILLIYTEMIPSIRLCGYTQMEDLCKRGIVAFRAVRSLQVRNADLRWADVAIFGRSDSCYDCALAQQFQKAGKCVAYIIDDDLLNVPDYLASYPYLSRQDIRKNIKRMLSLSDVLISPSPLLLSKYAPVNSGIKGILIEEPAILPVDYIPHDFSEPVHIGFAGSIDRTQDVEVILKDALLRIKNEYGDNVSFTFYGAIPTFAEALDAKTIPYCDSYEAYRETLNALQWDIGLAPMPQTSFHACKHYNKFVEYAASGVVGIYSDTEPYLRLKDWNNAGLFCKNQADDWYSSIKFLLEHRDKLETMRRQVCTYCRNELSIQTSAEDFYRQLTANMPKKKRHAFNLCFITLYKIMHFLIRGFCFLIHHRKDLPAAIWAKFVELQ